MKRTKNYGFNKDPDTTITSKIKSEVRPISYIFRYEIDRGVYYSAVYLALK